MSRISQHLPGLARKRNLPHLPGTNAVDLAPLVAALPVLSTVNITTGKESYAAQGVRERLESRAHRVQQPLIQHANAVVKQIANEKRQRVRNDLGEDVEVSVGGLKWMVDAGISEQPHSVAVAFEERKNALLRHRQIVDFGKEGQRGGKPEVERMRDDLEYLANQDISI